MITLDTIQLPQFIWLNRFGYSAFVSNAEFALDGSQHVEVASKQAGRSVVLYSDGEALSLFDTLETHANAAGATAFSLDINGTVLSVMWDYGDQPISGVPAINYSDGDPEQIDTITLKLITV
ncbi:hypothetical protein [Shewanella psychrotolerans]|uniref:hypothetical protein n=1 Tax=Shewanella psychrotolerans TaxID=2864206 RepID=UPI001C659A75|nr:hypothetical protein [Shewanella psychrotolerans]QYK02801.1 hypothetical protein K0I62_07640 [Shewanella psychrotolerans]